MKLPKNLKHDIVKGVDDMKEHELLSSEKGKQLFELHEITVPGLPFEVDGKALEDRWKERDADNGKGRFISFIHDGNKLISMVSGIDTEDGQSIFINTATRPEYRNQGFLEKSIAGYVESKELGSSVTALLSTKVNGADVADEQVRTMNEEIQGMYDSGKSNAQMLPEVVRILRENAGEDKVVDLTKRDNFSMLTKFMEREGTDETRYRLDKGSSSLNLVANVPVTERLKETSRNIMNGQQLSRVA